jgi:prepilin-type N-terminal cleavage/methylation domain-containing protein
MAEAAQAQAKASGFTLLELLIVIVILGMIMVAVGNGVRFAGQAWLTEQRRNAQTGDLDAVQGVVRNLIASGRDFEGDGTSLRFISPLPEALARGGLYELDLHATGGRLVLDWKPHFKGASAALGTTETELARDVRTVTFAYYVTSAGWKGAIADKTKPPGAILVTLRTEDGRLWPPLAVAAMVDGERVSGSDAELSHIGATPTIQR